MQSTVIFFEKYLNWNFQRRIKATFASVTDLGSPCTLYFFKTILLVKFEEVQKRF